MYRWSKMKCIVLLVLSTVFGIDSYSQAQDSPAANRSEKKYSTSFGKNAKGFERYEIDGQKNISYTMNNFKNTEIFEKIVYLESQECEALKARDSLRLMTLWARDFTLEETQSLVASKGGIPFYTGLYRVVENITPIDSVTVMCTGIEYQKQIATYHTEADQKKKFFHIWTNVAGIWKLTTKRAE